MREILNNLFSDSIGLVKVISVIGVLALGLTIISVVVAKSKEKKFSFEELNLNNEKERKIEKNKGVKLFFWEEIIFKMFHIKNPSTMIVIMERLLLCAVILIMGFTFHYLAIYFVFEIIMFVYSKNKEKKVEDDNGLTYIPKTNAFLDMYIPAVNNGQSVNQIMDRFVMQEKDPELTLWWESPDRDEIEPPLAWNDVIKIYKNGYYSEQNGNEDSAEVYQKDIMKQMVYYNNFKEKIGEINPIKMCYYIFMPIILIISWINDPLFWSDIFGLVDTIVLCMLLFMFTFFITNLHKETCDKLF